MKQAKPAPRHAAREARTEVYRQHIVEAAEQVFAERGYEAATLQEIGKRVGLSMGTIYSVFPSKTDLLQAILDARGQTILDLVRGVVGRGASPRDTLNDLSRAYIEFFGDHPAFLRMHLRQGSSWVISPGNSTSRAEVWEEIHALQANIFKRGVDDGTFVDEEPGFLAKLFSALDQVLLSEWAASNMKTDRAELVRRLESMVERTFCKRPRAATRRA